jgi:hypothetical protein
VLSSVQDEDYQGGSNSSRIRCSGSNSTLAHLPSELLALIKSRLDTKQRCGGCAGTCHQLAAAAGAATKKLKLSCIRQQQADALALWLAKHSSKGLHSLDLGGIGAPWLNLPVNDLVQLKSLKLSNIDLQQYSTASAGIPSHSQIRQLAVLSGLQHLELHPPEPCPTASSNGHNQAQSAALAYGVSLSAALGQLGQLTELRLSGTDTWRLPGSAMAPGSSLSQLQHLKLENVGTVWKALKVA